MFIHCASVLVRKVCTSYGSMMKISPLENDNSKCSPECRWSITTSISPETIKKKLSRFFVIVIPSDLIRAGFDKVNFGPTLLCDS